MSATPPPRPLFPRHSLSQASVEELISSALSRLTSLGLPGIETIQRWGWRPDGPGWYLCTAPDGRGRLALLPDGTVVLMGRRVKVRKLDEATRLRVVTALEYVILWGRPARDPEHS